MAGQEGFFVQPMAPDFMQNRYIDNNDGALSDRFTGLMWQTTDSYPENGAYLNWHDANAYIERLNRSKLGGHEDWRLPSKMELQSIYEINKTFESRGKTYVLHIDPIFEFSYGSCFWTRKTRLSAALGFEFDAGDFHWYPQASESGSARAVRLDMNSFELLSFYNSQARS